MDYEIKGHLLITNQPSMPQKEVTEFYIEGDFLELNFEGVKSRYIRV